ncbi:putative tetratricopeptide-like helical domain superfamily [Helianthus annuus]|uniref:Putative pentatricopeptide repeat protein n=1 Tax=Helianthus annuus TaxID=4232 RepID=A0A251UXZ6_HELAN|nr:putative tetratricopeptide-like helical domain superfamily [Helianthus annuus]KAJ0581073.1 putative tetratricopeptide-like helical domain superfamily [Helianthus annuus]KAJ0588878.1 putative tetratricopeptide-like helical domain superfamily [Helianthus annuus]KAJ0597019.1 putative tetratricopeptide-like helical domain superfamily [Helianthus annuus]KAJ0757701.1 putative tetratricopeptide-like helical domain superfamily [Helianthus annuus]
MGPEVLGSILHQCSKTRSFRHGFSLHDIAIKMCFISNIIISNHVLNTYAKCGKIEYARQVFDEMSERNVVSWSAMIYGYDQAGRALNAVQLFSQMKVEQTNEFVFASTVSACASLLAVDVGKRIHLQSVVLGYADVSFVSNSLVSMYSFERKTIAYNTIIIGLVENEQVQKAYVMFQLMLYSKFNLIEDAEKIFWSIEEKYMISWNTFTVVCCHALDHAKGLSVFSKMIKTHSLTPDDFTYTSAKSTNHSAKLQLSFSVKI